MLARLELFSQTLDMSTNILVIGPKKIEGIEPFKVVYLLHGLTGSPENWLQYSNLPLWAREGNTLFILPDAQRSWYQDAKYGLAYFSYIANELPQLCARIFNLSTKRNDTAIMGNSMGGYGALRCALTYPERYKRCVAFSPAALYWQDYLATPNCAGLLTEFQGIFGADITVPENAELSLLAAHAAAQGVDTQFKIFCGDNDFLTDLNRRFAKQLSSMNLDFEYQEWQGEHDWIFWNRAMKYTLEMFPC